MRSEKLEKWSKNIYPANSFWDLDAINKRAKLDAIIDCMTLAMIESIIASM